MNTDQPIDSLTQENTTENENIGLPLAANVPQKSTNETQEMSLNTAHHLPHDSNSHEQGATFRIEQELKVPVPVEMSQKILTEEEAQLQQFNPGTDPKYMKEALERLKARLN